MKAIRAYAVVKKDKPRIDVLDMFRDKDVMMTNSEELWEVEVTPIKKISTSTLKKHSARKTAKR